MCTTYKMFTKLTQNYILEQLITFKIGPRCCQQFSVSFRSTERHIFMEYAIELGFRTLPYVYNGMMSVKVYKKACLHFIEEPMYLRLLPNTIKDLYTLQCREGFIGSQGEMQISSDFISAGGGRPIIPPHRFSLGLKQSMARQNYVGQENFQKSCRLQPYKQSLLEAVNRSRVLIVNGDVQYDKSVALPMYIIESCAERRCHCKIVCVEREQLLAIYNSERLSEHLGEKVGNTVAFQVHLQSRISEASNLIYTTASFLLRVLMGQVTIDSFRHISHVIVGDIQMHEAYADLLLYELRAALRCHSHLKVVLLSNSKHNEIFINYFGEGEIFELQRYGEMRTTTEEHLKQQQQQEEQLTHRRIIFMDDIRKIVSKERSCQPELLAYSTPPTVLRDFGSNREQLDICLENYDRSGSDQAFEAFLYMVHGEYASVNYRHSTFGYTAAILAARLGNSSHLRRLLQLHADPFIMDERNLNAISSAIYGGNTQCIELMNSYCASITQCVNDNNPEFCDYTLITDLIRLILNSNGAGGCDWKPGNIIVLVANYEQLIRLDFSLLRHKLIGNLPEEISISMLHSNIEKKSLEALINPTECIRIILSTDIAEALTMLHSIAYVIDMVRVQRAVFNAESCCVENIFEWISKEAIERRTALIDSVVGAEDHIGICFRLIPYAVYVNLPEVHTPELLRMPLDRICLTVKLLSPHNMVAEYLQDAITSPPFRHVHYAVEHLKKLNVFDDLEDVTWLGCRIIDVPVDAQLGKLLVFAVLLQCLDPVLTIVSFLATMDPLELPGAIEEILQPYVSTIRNKMKEERKRLAENVFSDHLIYLRLYQEWQSDLRDDSPEVTLFDEHHFVFNGILEKICDMRTYLVGALRSSQLIHNQGPLSMHYINLKSNSWPMIKAALVGGLYPKVCVVARNMCRLKSCRARQLVLHPSSVLRELLLDPLNVSAQKFNSPWIIYGGETDSITCNSIKCCTLVSPLTIAMFAGHPRLPSTNITPAIGGGGAGYSATMQHHPDDPMLPISNFYIDEWIWFSMYAREAQLLLKTRQYFYSTYMNYLQHCGDMDKWRRTSSTTLMHITRLFETLDRVLTMEDLAYGFRHPENVGLRPKAMPNKFIASFNAALSADNTNSNIFSSTTGGAGSCGYTTVSTQHCWKQPLQLTLLERQFFMVHLTDHIGEPMVYARKYTQDWLRDAVTKVIGPFVTPDKLTYIIMYTKCPDKFCTIALAKKYYGVLRLHECFKNKVPIYELINICSKHNIYIPAFNERRVAFPLDKRVGTIILDLFAFRNNWLHNN